MRARSLRPSFSRRMGNTARRASVSAASACSFSFAVDGRGGGAESCAEAFIVAKRRENRTTRVRRHMGHLPQHRKVTSSLSWTPQRRGQFRSEEHTSELQSRENLVCRLLLEKK